MVVNKARPLRPRDYEPQDLVSVADAPEILLRPEAARALDGMRREASRAGHRLTVLSGYRSHEHQRRVHERWRQELGAAADAVSARQGHSEHQTGLAVDLGDATAPDCDLDSCFGSTAAGQWVAAHAADHGFIVRYPAGAEHVTGYAPEPWHLRHVGRREAQEILDADEPLETVWGLEPAPDYVD